MVKKKDVKLGSYLGSPEAFASQFFSQMVTEIELYSFFAKAMDEGILIHYKSGTPVIDGTQAWDFVPVLYTSFGALVSGDNVVGTGYRQLCWLFWRCDWNTFPASESAINVRYDTVYVEDSVLASWSALRSYIQTRGITDVVRKTGRLPGQGLVYDTNVILIPYTLNDTTGVFTGDAFRNLFNIVRTSVLDAYLKSSKDSQLEKVSAKMFARSQEMWPEMKGLWTRFIDNVGVYLPSYLDVDVNLTLDLGSRYVGCWMTRVPSSSFEGALYKFEWMMTLTNGILSMAQGGSSASTGAGYSEGAQSTIHWPAPSGMKGGKSTTTVGGSPGYQGAAASAAIGLGQGIMNLGLDLAGPKRSLDTFRVVMPRIRGFGRQYTADVLGNVSTIPSYNEAKARCESLFGVGKEVAAGGLTGTVYQYYQKRVLLFPKSEWDKWIEDMNKIVSLSASATGGLQGFPY